MITLYKKFNFSTIFSKKYPTHDANAGDGCGAIHCLNFTMFIRCTICDEIIAMRTDSKGRASVEYDLEDVSVIIEDGEQFRNESRIEVVAMSVQGLRQRWAL
jgi:hypothetical protein